MSTIELEAGKFYRTQGGYKVGPMKFADIIGGAQQFTAPHGSGYRYYRKDGSRWHFDDRGGPTELIAEWTEPTSPSGAVRTVTRKEIVPGTYGRVKVGVSSGDASKPWVAIEATLATASELRAAAALFLELAAALEPQP